ncbi:MAG: Integrase catalytic region [Actinoallomurus sp.]|nr:Integrase catalytic region [Actinoallomurus sp.]
MTVWDQPGPGNKVYGADKIWRQLNHDGVEVARCTVERLMRDLGIQGVGTPAKKPRTTVLDPAAAYPSDLLERDFTAAAPNTRWVADITYVPTENDGWCYTAFIMDCYSRAVVGWACSGRMYTELVLDALDMAIWARKGRLGDRLVHRSDRGSQYTSISYTDRLAEMGAARSVGSKGDSYDNAAAESLNSLYKRELIDRLGPWNDLTDVTKNTMEWVAWYNSERLHSHCKDVSPFEYEEAFYQTQQPAA